MTKKKGSKKRVAKANKSKKTKHASAKSGGKKAKKKKEPPHIGSLAANIHEGGRSEYLAHYAFSSFGSAHLVPRQEDHGLDLFCTLTEKDGHRLWPIANYCVQIKSTADAWEFPSENSVNWFVHYPLPIFFCVVDKKELKLSVFHTSPRFFAWTSGPKVNRLVLVPGKAGTGYGAEWEQSNYVIQDADTLPLSAPIAEFTLENLVDADFHSRIQKVLSNWVELDRENIFRIQAGLPLYRTFSEYTTNDPEDRGFTFGGRIVVDADELKRMKAAFVEQNKWLSWHLAETGDYRGALRADLFLRHLDELDWMTDSVGSFHLYSRLRQHFESDKEVRKKNFYAGLDGLSRQIDDLTEASITEAHAARAKDAADLASKQAEEKQNG